MKLNVAGLQMETGDALKAHCQERMEALKKYFDQVIDVDVSYRIDPHHNHRHLAEVSIHANGIHLHAIGEGDDAYKATDDAEGKLERQLKRYKGRLQKHRKRQQEMAEQMKSMPEITVTDNEVKEDTLEDMLSDLAPEIEHKRVSRVQAMTVDDAVMQMDLLHKPAFLFQNAKSGKLNIVYRESENKIRWIEPGEIG